MLVLCRWLLWLTVFWWYVSFIMTMYYVQVGNKKLFCSVLWNLKVRKVYTPRSTFHKIIQQFISSEHTFTCYSKITLKNISITKEKNIGCCSLLNDEIFSSVAIPVNFVIISPYYAISKNVVYVHSLEPGEMPS